MKTLVRADKETCQRCKEVGEDRRTLWMACLYRMDELGLPFQERKEGDKYFYTLLVCKDCRADWMAMIKLWFTELPPIKTSVGSGIFIRENGIIKEITEEEWHQKNPDRDPVRVLE